MCRSIKVLRKPGQPASVDEVNSAALQFVRKISGMHKPSKANQDAFNRAILHIADASRRLLDEIATPPKRPEPDIENSQPRALNT